MILRISCPICRSYYISEVKCKNCNFDFRLLDDQKLFFEFLKEQILNFSKVSDGLEKKEQNSYLINCCNILDFEYFENLPYEEVKKLISYFIKKNNKIPNLEEKRLVFFEDLLDIEKDIEEIKENTFEIPIHFNFEEEKIVESESLKETELVKAKGIEENNLVKVKNLEENKPIETESSEENEQEVPEGIVDNFIEDFELVDETLLINVATNQDNYEKPEQKQKNNFKKKKKGKAKNKKGKKGRKKRIILNIENQEEDSYYKTIVPVDYNDIRKNHDKKTDISNMPFYLLIGGLSIASLTFFILPFLT